MNIKFANFRPNRGALIGLLLPLIPAVATAVDVSSMENVLEISGGGVSLDGDNAAYAKRHQVNPDGFGGIERFYYTSSTDKGTVTIEGRALAGNNDYLLSIKFANDERGWISFGYREFSTWYDGSGSVIPLAATKTGGNTSIILGDELYHTNRSQAWIEGLFKATENLDLHFKYTHNERFGKKDSTFQGDTTLTGGLGTRRIIPAFYKLDETQDMIEADATLRADKSEFGAAVRFDNREIDNARYMRRRAFEHGQDRSITHREMNDSDLFTARGYISHRYSDQLAFNTAYSHTKLDTVLGGSRIVGMGYNATWDPLFANRQQRDEGFFNLTGDSQTKLDVANINAVYTPTETFAIIPSFRIERETREVISEFTETNFSSSKVASAEELEVLSDRKWDEWVLGVETRYTGIKNWVFTGRATWSEGDGELAEDREEHHVSLISRDSLISKWTSKYALAAHWYPTSKANVTFLYSRWNRYTDYDTLATSANSSVTSGDRYPAFIKSLDYDTNDFAVKLTIRSSPGFMFVTRYDIQTTDIEANQLSLSKIGSGNYDSKIFSQSVNWNPAGNVFVQGMINNVQDTLHTPANDATGAAAGLVQATVNDYWTSAITVGFSTDEQTDVFLQYNYFFADNFIENSNVSVPYGLSRRDQSFSATCARAINDRTKVSFRYAWAKNDEDSSAGLNDFEAHLLYGKVEYRF